LVIARTACFAVTRREVCCKHRREARVERGRTARELDSHDSRLFGPRRRAAWRRFAAAAGEAALRFAKRAGIAREQRRELRIAFRRRHERGGVLRDPLRQERELIRVFRLALARPLLRRALRHFHELLAALRDRRRALRHVDQPLLAFQELLDASIHPVPSCLDAREQRMSGIVLRGVERHAFDRPAALQRIEVHLEALVGVAHRFERDRAALQRQRGAARKALRQHLHLRRRRRRRRGLRRGPDVERHHERRKHEEQDQQDAEDVELPGDRQMPDQRHFPRRPRAIRRCAHLLEHRDGRERVVAVLRRRRLGFRAGASILVTTAGPVSPPSGFRRFIANAMVPPDDAFETRPSGYRFGIRAATS
jgi:hypothetical protein